MIQIKHDDIRDAFTQYHYVETLAITPFAKSFLVANGLWMGRDQASYLNLALATRTLLDWGLRMLEEQGTVAAVNNVQALNLRYRQQLSISAYAQKYNLLERKIHRRRLSGTKQLSDIFQKESEQLNWVDERCRMTFEAHYNHLTPKKRRFLHTLALLEQPIVIVPNKTKFPKIDPSSFSELKQNHLIIVDEKHLVCVHDKIKPYIVARIAQAEKQQLSRLIANHNLGNQNGLDAAAYFLMANDQRLAAEALLMMPENTIEESVPQIKELLKQFSRQQVDVDMWGELMCLNGRVLGLTDDILESIKAYQEALSTRNEAIQVKSHHALALAYQRTGNPSAALTHIDIGIDLLSRRPKIDRDSKLLIELYLRQAMLYTSSVTNYDKARLALEYADSIANEQENIDSREWLSIRSDIELRWGRYEHQIDNVDEAVHRYMRSHVYALEANDVKMRMKIAYYLGVVYSYGRQNYHEALKHYYEGKKLAEQSGQTYFLSSIHVSIATCLYECGEYAEAVRYLEDVYLYATQTNNNYILTLVVYNLVRVYLRWEKVKAGIAYYMELCDMETWLNTSYLTLCISNIRQEFPFIDDTLNDRQLRGLLYLQKHEHLTRQTYMILNDVGRSVTQSELGILVSQGWCERHGRGRSTHYSFKPQLSE